jgi:hypothetical protein
VVGAKFSFTKLHSSKFFGTGLMEIPPGGYKLKKNSRKMTMAFFVHTGKVDVTVAESEFTITKGGIWHVPRGMCIFLSFSVACSYCLLAPTPFPSYVCPLHNRGIQLATIWQLKPFYSHPLKSR